MAKYDYDSYTIYEMKRRPVYAVKIRVILTEQVRGDVLASAATKAFRRFPYYNRTITLSDEAYIMPPSDKPIVVTDGDHVVRLGSEESNRLYGVGRTWPLYSRRLYADRRSLVDRNQRDRT